jgi:hypothetical protein
MNVVILQPSYIPWRGFFHQVQKADVFVFYDCVQYDDRGWRNRNQIRTPQGLQWLSIPVNAKGAQSNQTPIADVPIVWDANWPSKHLTSLRHSYGKAPFFREYLPMLEEFYERRDEKLADFTCDFTVEIARRMGIQHTQFLRSSNLPAVGTKTERLLSILTHLGAKHYISGPSAKSYMDLCQFDAAGISVEYMSYDYPEYSQVHGRFEPQVSVLDLLFNVGSESHRFIWDLSTT